MPGRPVRPDLFPDQVEAVERLVQHLRRPGSRGLFVSATGTGKTLASIWVADGLEARLVLSVVPTLDLAAQTALAWRRDHHLEYMVIVSSMDTSGRDDLAAARHVDDGPACAGWADVGGGGGAGPDSRAHRHLHLRLSGQD
ncbi:DEAD/DEAH box helicase family protein [Streptomyces flaveolus]|uniref:DEAD/DEAH box helicase family protein n=1 Tax=Streptomyces flaveolus TaxID=67297 RepID=UPI0036F7E8E1